LALCVIGVNASVAKLIGVTCLGQIAAPMILLRTVTLTIVFLTAAERVA
jgi:hypothetical protein